MSEGNGFSGNDRGLAESHRCSQEVTLNTICIALENIEKVIAEIRKDQSEYLKEIQAVRIMEASYPTPEEFKDRGITIERHDVYFKIVGSALVAAWAVLLFLADKLWQGGS
jgi:hypothetical protein